MEKITIIDLTKSSIASWVLAKLYDQSQPLHRLELLKMLCQESFDLMNETNEYPDTLKTMVKLDYIAFKDEKYSIEEQGIIAVRRQLITPIINLKKEGTIEKVTERFKQLVDSLHDYTDVAYFVTRNIVSNAPLFLDFITWAIQLLSGLP